MPVGLRGFPADRDREFLVGVRVLKSNASKFSCHKVNFFKQMGDWLGQLESTFIPLEPKLPNCKEEEGTPGVRFIGYGILVIGIQMKPLIEGCSEKKWCWSELD